MTDQPIGYLGNVSDEGLMLISSLPMMVGGDFELRLKIPTLDGCICAIDLTATCLWCEEDVTPRHYDAGFSLLHVPQEYAQLVGALQRYFSFLPLQASARFL